MAYFGYPVYTLWFNCSLEFLNYFVYQAFDVEPETRRAH